MDITDYIRDVYNNFVDYVQDDANLCDLKDLRFDCGIIPDYSDVHMQEYYLLRYAYAYEFSYERIFEKLLTCYSQIRNQVSTVLSIGCGSGLDAFGFYNKYTWLNRSKLQYIGIDRIDWSYKFNPSGYDIEYYNADILEWLNEQETLDVDIISFPKSISELSNKLIDSIAERIIQINQTNELFIVASIRANEFTCSDDIELSDRFVKGFLNNGYEFVDGNIEGEYWTFTREKEGIFRYNGHKGYPDEALELIKSLSQQCASVEVCGECTELNRQPTLTVDTIKYRIVHIKRS